MQKSKKIKKICPSKNWQNQKNQKMRFFGYFGFMGLAYIKYIFSIVSSSFATLPPKKRVLWKNTFSVPVVPANQKTTLARLITYIIEVGQKLGQTKNSVPVCPSCPRSWDILNWDKWDRKTLTNWDKWDRKTLTNWDNWDRV